MTDPTMSLGGGGGSYEGSSEAVVGDTKSKAVTDFVSIFQTGSVSSGSSKASSNPSASASTNGKTNYWVIAGLALAGLVALKIMRDS